MTKIYNSILDLVGHTPLLKLNKFMSSRKLEAEIIAKLEYFNPAGSVKDRVARFCNYRTYLRKYRCRSCHGCRLPRIPDHYYHAGYHEY